MTRLLSLLAACFAVSGLGAQNLCPAVVECPERSAGIYHAYEFRPDSAASRPEGYVPFYISHYGRHGCRWHSSEAMYVAPRDLLRKAAACDALTGQGRELLRRVEIAAADADGRWGDLSLRGVEEHRAIAGRMFDAYPEVFATDGGRACRIQSRSTLVPRVILSMAAFNERLKEANPAIRISRESSRRYLPYLDQSAGRDAQRKAAMAVGDSLLRAWIEPDAFMKRIFADPAFVAAEVESPQKAVFQLFLLAAIMQDVDELGISLYEFFTAEEIDALWRYDNARRYFTMGPSLRFGDPIVVDARPLLRNIVETAQQAVDGSLGFDATLRFGHDVDLIPLLALMGVEGTDARVADPGRIAEVWQLFRVSPMATNVQLIFFRHPHSGDVRVRVLHNERDARLPVDGGPFYPWPALRDYLRSRCEP